MQERPERRGARVRTERLVGELEVGRPTRPLELDFVRLL
jgi:hypothetical protein